MSKMKVLSLAAALALPLAVNAQPAAQDWEVILGGNGSATSDFDGGQFGATMALGYYLNDNLEVAFRQSLGYQTSGRWVGSTRAAVDYNIIMDKFVPFIGGNLGYAYGNRGVTDSWGFGPEAGIKYYLQSKAFLFGMAEYQMPFKGKTFKDGNWQFTLGLGVNL
jgi:hypothetical protein